MIWGEDGHRKVYSEKVSVQASGKEEGRFTTSREKPRR